jgi:hypothetical protein
LQDLLQRLARLQKLDQGLVQERLREKMADIRRDPAGRCGRPS